MHYIRFQKVRLAFQILPLFPLEPFPFIKEISVWFVWGFVFCFICFVFLSRVAQNERERAMHMCEMKTNGHSFEEAKKLEEKGGGKKGEQRSE